MTISSSSGQRRRIALLIDAENIPPSSALIKAILHTIERNGQPTYRRIYGDWAETALHRWKPITQEHALETRHHFANKPGKNSTDIALVIDAMDILYSGTVDGFYLVTSDSDFTALAMRIRRSHRFVVGAGRRNTHVSFVKACNHFTYLETIEPSIIGAAPVVPNAPAKPAPKKAAPVPVNGSDATEKEAELRELSVKAMNLTQAPAGWVDLSEFSNRLLEIKPDFKRRDYALVSKLSDMIRAYPKLFEIKAQGKSTLIKLR